jgi:hypothetical protein
VQEEEEEEVGGEVKEKSGRMLGFVKKFIILDYFDNVGQRKDEGWLELERTRERLSRAGTAGHVCRQKNEKSG